MPQQAKAGDDPARFERLKDWTIRLARCRSVVGTEEERQVVLLIREILAEFPYFRRHPEHLRLIETPHDPLQRLSLFAVVESDDIHGHSVPGGKTLVLIGHTDTVEIEDYGDLRDAATEPEVLANLLGQRQLPRAVREDLASGDYLFGRGVFDMKAGVANIIEIIRSFSERTDSWHGRLVMMGVSDEEGESSGMLACIEELNRARTAQGWDLLGVVDTDYQTACYPGDLRKYIYTGTVGKLLTTFYVRGKETHAGDPFAGLDANLLASEIVREINLSLDYADDKAVPPITLRQSDLKEGYSVQTSYEAVVAINCTTCTQTPQEVLDLMMAGAGRAAGRVGETMTERWTRYCELQGWPLTARDYRAEVVSFAGMLADTAAAEGRSESELKEILLREVEAEFACSEADGRQPYFDARRFSEELVKRLELRQPERTPRIVCFFAPPYYPHNNSDEREPRAGRLIAATRRALVQAASGQGDSGTDRGVAEDIVFKRFYPYISDLSYVSYAYPDGTEDEFIGNTPGYAQETSLLNKPYSLPFDTLRQLDLPVVNVGSWGFDAHQWSERVQMPYSFGTLPHILENLVTDLLA